MSSFYKFSYSFKNLAEFHRLILKSGIVNPFYEDNVCFGVQPCEDNSFILWTDKDTYWLRGFEKDVGHRNIYSEICFSNIQYNRHIFGKETDLEKSDRRKEYLESTKELIRLTDEISQIMRDYKREQLMKSIESKLISIELTRRH